MPTLLMKASPGPVVRKNPPARRYIVGSVRKMRVSVLRRNVFLAAVSGASRGLLLWSEEGELAVGVMVP